jgi:hypothetical protein
MKTKSQHSTAAQPISIGVFFERFHAVLFAITIGGGLALAVFLLMNILNSSSAPEGYAPPSTNASFDAQTIDKVEALRPLSTTPTEPALPSGRTDPFAQ